MQHCRTTFIKSRAQTFCFQSGLAWKIDRKRAFSMEGNQFSGAVELVDERRN